MLWRLKRDNQRWRRYAAMLVNENRWRAQRYGIDEGLVDFGKGRIVPYADLLEEMIQLVAEDAEAFGCQAEVAEARAILTRGTSAHRQPRPITRRWPPGRAGRGAGGGGRQADCGDGRGSLDIDQADREELHGRQDPHRTGGRDLPPPGGASAGTQGRAEHRPHESRRFLPQLPLELVSGRGRGARHRPARSRGPRDRLRHALRGLEGEVPEGRRNSGAARAGGEETAAVTSTSRPTRLRAALP